MKAGFNLLTWARFIDEAVLPPCAMLKDAGFDGVELPMFSGTPAHYAAMGARLRDLGLGATALGILPGPQTDPLSADPAVRGAARDHLRWLVDCAAALGAEVLGGPLYQPLGLFTGRGPTEAEIARMIDGQRELAAYAAAAGLVLAVEPVNRFEGYAVTTTAQAQALVDAVGAPGYGILLDTFHAHIEERDTPAAIRAAGARMRHIHLSESDRGMMGLGQIDFDAVIGALAAVGYDGWLTVESFGDARPEIATAVRAWRPLIDSDAAAISAAIQTIRRGIRAAGGPA